MIIDILLAEFIAVCVFSDIKYRKVYNAITFPVIALGLGLNFINFGLLGLKE